MRYDVEHGAAGAATRALDRIGRQRDGVANARRKRADQRADLGALADVEGPRLRKRRGPNDRVADAAERNPRRDLQCKFDGSLRCALSDWLRLIRRARD